MLGVKSKIMCFAYLNSLIFPDSEYVRNMPLLVKSIGFIFDVLPR